MAITRLKSFGGEAEVLGRLCEFEFESPEGGQPYLIIHGLTLIEAESALIMLSSGRVEGVRPPMPVGQATGAPPPVPEGAGSRTKPEPPPPPKVEGKKEKPAPTDLDKAKVGKPPDTEKPAEKPVDKNETKPAAGETKQPPAETKSPPAETKPAETKPAEPAPADGDPDAVFIKASKMRDILYALQDRGINDEAAMVAECERLKNKVTLLAKMPNIADRVKRTLEVMKGGVAA